MPECGWLKISHKTKLKRKDSGWEIDVCAIKMLLELTTNIAFCQKDHQIANLEYVQILSDIVTTSRVKIAAELHFLF